MGHNVYVSNITDELNEQQIRELFECCGNPTAVEFQKVDGQRRATITYAEEHEATSASLLNGTPLGDKALVVSMKPIEDTPAAPDAVASSLAAATAAAAAAAAAGAAVLPANPPLLPTPTLPTMMPTAATMAAQPIAGTVPNAAAAIAAQAVANLPAQFVQANNARVEEIARTIYIGNLAQATTHQALALHFSKAGTVLYVKLAGSDPTAATRYGFIEFKTAQGATNALLLNGTIVGQQQIKIGRANNPIVKDGLEYRTAAGQMMMPQPKPDKVKLSAAMKKVREAQRRLEAMAKGEKYVPTPDSDDEQDNEAKDIAKDSDVKNGGDDKNKDKRRNGGGRRRERSRSPRRHNRDRDRGRRSRRSRSRSRGRRSRRDDRSRRRSRSRDRGRRSRRSRSRSSKRDHKGRGKSRRDRSWPRSGGKGGKKKQVEERPGEYFDGYGWRPKPTADGDDADVESKPSNTEDAAEATTAATEKNADGKSDDKAEAAEGDKMNQEE